MAKTLDIKFGTELHDRMRSLVHHRVMLSRTKLQERFDAWEAADDLYTAYVPETADDAIRSDERDSGLPQYTTITIP